jgi:hypothetical protein
MLSTVFLMVAMIGQTNTDVPVLSEATKKAQERALAELRANEPAIRARLAAHHQQENERLERENQRLMDRIEAVNIATGRVWSVTSGSMGQAAYSYREPWASGGFASVPPAGRRNTPNPQTHLSTDELRRVNQLLKGHLRDSQDLHRQANQLYNAEVIRQYQLATSASYTAAWSPSRTRREEHEDGK